MTKLTVSLLVLFVCVSICSCGARAAEPRGPLSQSELMALVVGAALPENIMAGIRQRGLSFHVDAAYRAQIEKAGGDPGILAALDSAKTMPPASGQAAPNPETVEHLANAGKLMKENNYSDAAKELNAVLTANFQSSEAGFVMGQLLRAQQRWDEAARVYTEVLRQDANFPEAHTKLSFLYYRLEQPDDGLREAKAALALTPDNAEAHKNAGLALATMRKFDAAQLEYDEALRLKPDYAAAHLDMAIMLAYKGDWRGSIEQYQKDLVLDPSDVDAHYNLGLAFDHVGDFQSSLREYREAIRLAPMRYDARQNLAAGLLNHGFAAEAVIGVPRIGKALSRRANVPPLFGIGALQDLGLERRRGRIHAGGAVGSV